MKKERRNLTYLIPLVVFIIIVLFLGKGLKRDPHLLPSALINKPLPAFQMTALNNARQMITNRDFMGHVSILNVFATWCLTCQVEHPLWVDIAHSYQVAIYGLDYKDSNRQAVQAWLQKYDNPYTAVIYDPQGLLGIDLGVYGTPETFVIDQQGIIRYKHIGSISVALWRSVLLPEIKRLQQQ